MKIYSNTNSLIIDSKKVIERIMISDILYIEKIGNKSVLRTKEGEISIRITLNNMLSYFPDNFIRCHRSFIVNINTIRKITYLENSNSCQLELFSSGVSDYILCKKENIKFVLDIIKDI